MLLCHPNIAGQELKKIMQKENAEWKAGLWMVIGQHATSWAAWLQEQGSLLAAYDCGGQRNGPELPLLRP